ncbi:hypothetical protein V8C86DRAFT_2442187 [Haematococcus lacustris]
MEDYKHWYVHFSPIVLRGNLLPEPYRGLWTALEGAMLHYLTPGSENSATPEGMAAGYAHLKTYAARLERCRRDPQLPAAHGDNEGKLSVPTDQVCPNLHTTACRLFMQESNVGRTYLFGELWIERDLHDLKSITTSGIPGAQLDAHIAMRVAGHNASKRLLDRAEPEAEQDYKARLKDELTQDGQQALLLGAGSAECPLQNSPGAMMRGCMKAVQDLQNSDEATPWRQAVRYYQRADCNGTIVFSSVYKRPITRNNTWVSIPFELDDDKWAIWAGHVQFWVRLEHPKLPGVFLRLAVSRIYLTRPTSHPSCLAATGQAVPRPQQAAGAGAAANAGGQGGEPPGDGNAEGAAGPSGIGGPQQHRSAKRGVVQAAAEAASTGGTRKSQRLAAGASQRQADPLPPVEERPQQSAMGSMHQGYGDQHWYMFDATKIFTVFVTSFEDGEGYGHIASVKHLEPISFPFCGQRLQPKARNPVSIAALDQWGSRGPHQKIAQAQAGGAAHHSVHELGLQRERLGQSDKDTCAGSNAIKAKLRTARQLLKEAALYQALGSGEDAAAVSIIEELQAMVRATPTMRSWSKDLAVVQWLFAAGLAIALAQSSAPPSTMDGCSAIVWGATYGLFMRNTTGVPRTPYGHERWSDFQQAVCRVHWGDFANAPRPLSPSEVASFHTIASVIFNNYNPSTLPTIPTAFLSYAPFLAVRDYTSIVCLDLPLAVLQQFLVDNLARQSTIFAGPSGVVYQTQYTDCLTKLKQRGFQARRLSAIDQEVLAMTLEWTTDTPDESSCQLGTVSTVPRLIVPVACRLTAPGLQPQTVNVGPNDITFQHGVQYHLSCTPSFPPGRPSVQVNFLITTELCNAWAFKITTAARSLKACKHSSACRPARDYVYGFDAYHINRTVTVSTCVDGVGAWDTVLYVLTWSEDVCYCPSYVTANDQGGVCGLNRSSVTFPAEADTYYIVVVEGYLNDVADLSASRLQWDII